MTSNPSLEEKVAFFDALEALDTLPADEESGHLSQDQPRCQSRAFFSPPDKKQSPHPEPSTHHFALLRNTIAVATLKRTASAPTSSHQQQDIVDLTGSAESHHPGTQADRPRSDDLMPQRRATDPASLKRSASAAAGLSSSSKSASKKRKRDSVGTVKMVPEAQRVLAGMRFYYVPIDNVTKRRTARIERVREYGAEIVENADKATHVIVDEEMKWDDLKETVTHVPAGIAPIVVRAIYPLQCITFQAVLDHTQQKYRVPGQPAGDALVTEDSPAPLSGAPPSSVESLQVKAKVQHNPDKFDYVPPRGTPQESEQTEVQASESSLDIPELPSQSPHEDTSDWVVIPSSLGQADAPNVTNPVSQVGDWDEGPPDRLSELIQQLRPYQDIAHLDDDDDDGPTPSEAGDADDDDEGWESDRSDGERERKRRSLAKTTNKYGKSGKWEDKFACNHGGSKDKASQEPSPNAATIAILQKMCDYYIMIMDHWRQTAYRRAIKTLDRQPVKITTAEEAIQLWGIGKRLADKIEEIVCTGRLRRLEFAEMDPADKILGMFLKIYGVGYQQAARWIAKGYKTLQDLRDNVKLTHGQQIGVDHYDDLNTRIPRCEVEALGEHVKKAAAKIDPDVELVIGGSFRRGSDSSGDIDFIVTKNGTTEPEDLLPFLTELVETLKAKKFLTTTLAGFHAPKVGEPASGSKWHGCCVLPEEDWLTVRQHGEEYRPIWRRIDFLLVPETQYGAALIYFTGNDLFNRSMRLLANKMGMRLNQRGLYKNVIRGAGGKKVSDGELVEGASERRIFEILGVRWREPTKRWC